MEAIVLWAKNICIAAVGCAVLRFLLPRGNAAKTARVVMGFFMVWMLFMPLVSVFSGELSADDSIDFEYEAEAGLSDSVSTYVEKQTAEMIQNLLDENGFSVSEVSVACHIEQDGVINITRIEIVTGGNAEEIRALVQQQTGLVPEVMIE